MTDDYFDELRYADVRDSAIMLSFMTMAGYRGVDTPITLATIGLGPDDVQTIARELSTGIDVAEGGEHIELCEHGQPIREDETSPSDCGECDQQRAEDSEVPADWFAGGFAENH